MKMKTAHVLPRFPNGFIACMQVALTILNFQWSYELFKKALRPARSEGKSHLL